MPIRSPIAVQTPNTCHSTNCLILFIKLKLHYFNLNSQHIFCNFATGRGKGFNGLTVGKVGGVENFQPLQKVGSIFRDARFTMLDNIYDFVPFYAFNTKRQTPNVCIKKAPKIRSFFFRNILKELS